MAEEASEILRLTVKTTKEKIEVEVAADSTAKQVPDGGQCAVDPHPITSLSLSLSLSLSVCVCVCVFAQLKELLSEKKSGLSVAQLCLIFAGRILKDGETLESQGEPLSLSLCPSISH